MLRQQLTTKNLVTKFSTSFFSMKMLFFCYFDCRFGYLDL